MHVDIYGNLKALARSLYYTGYSFCLQSYDEILLLDLIIYSLRVQRPGKLDLFSSCLPSLSFANLILNKIQMTHLADASIQSNLQSECKCQSAESLFLLI